MQRSLLHYVFHSLKCKITLVLLCSIAGLYTSAQTPVSGNFTINSALPSAGSNFQTFTEAVFSLAYGINGPVVFTVAPNSGPYNEQLTISTVTGTSATNTVTFRCNGVTLQNEAVSSLSRAVVKLDGTSHVTFDSLKVRAITNNTETSYGWGFALIHDADNNAIRNCSIDVNNRNVQNPQNNIGIYIGSTDDYPSSNGLSNCDNNIISGNTIIGGYWGIVLDNYGDNWNLHYSTMDNNEITNNVIREFFNSGIYLIWNRNTLVRGNDIGGTLGGSAYGIFINENNNNLKILSNRIHNVNMDATANSHGFSGIHVAYCESNDSGVNVIANNLIYDLRNKASQDGIAINGSTYFDISHNTIVLDTAGAASSSTTTGFLFESGNANINFRNNIISIQRTGSGSKYGVNVTAAGSAFVSDYNDIVVDAGINFGRYVSTNYPTLAGWQSGTLKDAHSASQNPLFTNAAGGNYKPTNPAVDNLGTYAGINSDIMGDIRNNVNPDAGAFEFLTPACAVPVVAGSGVGIPTQTVCSGGLLTLNLTGNSFGSAQTYQWQTSATANGTYSNIGGSLVVPAYDIRPTSTMFYRALVTCGSASATSNPVQISVNPGLSGANYTINSAAPTGANNFTSFADALLALKCGMLGPVVLNVVAGSGPYNEQVIINEINGLSATNTLTIKGNGASLSYLSTLTNERAVIKLNGADHVTIDGLNITATGATTNQYGFGIQLLNNADSNTIKNCTINVNTTSTSPNFTGIVVSSSATDAIGSSASRCDYNLITGNTINGGYYGITLYSDASVEKIYYNTISNNTIKDFYTYGIFVSGTDHSVIEGNDLSRPTRTNSGTCTGIYLTNISTAALISKNRIHNTFGGTITGNIASNAIYSNNCDATTENPNIISNNLVYDFGGTGAQVGLYNSSSDFNIYYHNTISLEFATGTTTATARAIYQTGSATGLIFKNNNVTIRRNGTGTNHAIYMNTAATSYAAENNNYLVAGTGTNRTGFVNGTNYTTLADWQAGSGKDATSLSVDPVYVNVASGNLTPTSSALDNKGSFAGVTTDINGLPRSVTVPDIGAYEFSGVLPVKLLSMSATRSVSDVLVDWTTTTEINSKNFIVERSINGFDFTAVGTVAAGGNLNSQSQYRFRDLDAASLAINDALYYRLRMVDLDGRFEYSKVVLVKFNSKNQVVLSVYPNPFVAELTATISSTKPAAASITVRDITGRSISVSHQQLVAGNNTIAIPGVSLLAKGVYVLNVLIDGTNYQQKVIK